MSGDKSVFRKQKNSFLNQHKSIGENLADYPANRVAHDKKACAAASICAMSYTYIEWISKGGAGCQNPGVRKGTGLFGFG
jgi:hypothetical protein